MIEIRLVFSEQEAVAYLKLKGYSPFKDTFLTEKHIHGSHFEDVIDECYVVMHKKKICKVREVFSEIFKQNLLK